MSDLYGEPIDGIIKRIKKIEGVLRNADVAKLLEISPQGLSNAKAKGSVPFKGIVKYCLKNKISINKLLEKEH
jgi:hypothetical protein